MFRKDFPQGLLGERNNPAKQMKEGCLMIIKGVKDFMKLIRITGLTLNLGFIGLNLAGSSS
ncbi:MAG TPA: hypothetical protein GX712_05450 [Bacteroidales bacterium]|nr:hypothetical protein [Bacteroidales bacterium]